MKNILGYLKKHKLIIIALGIVLIISLILILTLGNKIGNKPKVIENLSCPALNDIKTIVTTNPNNLVFTNSGDLYELSEKKYSNETNCKKINEDIKITGIYSFGFGMVTVFSEDKVYDIINSELREMKSQKPLDTVKAKENYNLKDNGIIYKHKAYDLSQGTFSNEEEFLKFEDEKILDFGIANSEINYIRTDKAYYTRKLANEQECTEYADVECKYELYKDNYLTENYDKVAGIIEENVIFKNGDVVDYDIENMHRLDEKLEISQNQENDVESEVIEETQEEEEQEDNNTTNDTPSNNTTKPNTNNSNQNNNTNTSNDTTKPNTSNDTQNNNQTNDTGDNQNNSNTQDTTANDTTTEETEQKELITLKSITMENEGGTFKIGDTITWHAVIESKYPLYRVAIIYYSSVNNSYKTSTNWEIVSSNDNEYNVIITKKIDESDVPGKWEFNQITVWDKYITMFNRFNYQLNYNSTFIVTE